MLETDKPRDACGVFGVFGHPDAARVTYQALFALQHRGQESAGIAVAGADGIMYHKGMGLVGDVFTGEWWSKLSGAAAVGHVRYSTFGASQLVNAQPLVVKCRQGWLALAHNGNLVNAVSLRSELENEGSIFQTGVDTEVLAHLIARQDTNDVLAAVQASLVQIRGGYALVILTGDHLIAARDAAGIRPLAIGDLDGCPVIASESCAFDGIGARTIGDVRPGELVVISREGVERSPLVPPEPERLCAFEFIYFARPDSNLRGQNVHAVRKALGRRLAQDYPVAADLVTGVPDSSLSAASGFAEAAGIPYEMGLVKNRYIGRTFIQPTQEQRSMSVRLKLNALRKVVKGKRVVLVDDSIVRGTTSRHIVHMLKDAGATEVHVRISSPPYRFPCYFGINTSSRGQLVAATRDRAAIQTMVDADSLEFLTLEALIEAAGGGGFCLGCFDGRYPIDVTDRVDDAEGGETGD